jgi:formylglycine-generating enzyme required for sulfatase activity
MAGDVSTGDGDFIGRDNTVHGDEVKRDKAGRDIYNFSGPVTVNQPSEGKAPPVSDKLPDSNESKGTPPASAVSPIDLDKQIDIFLSYSRIDAEIMRRLRDDLRGAGFTVWTDDVGLEPGTPSWQRAIEEAIQAAHCVVVLLSPEAKQSRWVEIEVSIAEDFGLRVFPLLVRGDDRNSVLFRLRTTQRIDVRHDYQTAVKDQLIPALLRYLQKAKSPEVIETKQPRASEVSEPPQPKLSEVIEPEQTKSSEPATKPANRLGKFVAIATVVIVSLIVILQNLMGAWTNRIPQALTSAPTTTPAFASPSTSVLTTTVAPILASTVVTKTNPKDGAVYVWIPPGEFTMGSSLTDTLENAYEKPQHKVTLDGFWIMQTEVTNAQYKRCVDAKVCETPNNERWQHPRYENHPVTDVTWYQGQAYAKWVGGHLPTEAEWEKACQGTDKRIYPWGNQPPSPQLLNYSGSKKDDTMPVGSYPLGTNGLYDMAGNVWEWTSSVYKPYPYKADDGREDPKAKELRTLRGGSFYYDDYVVRCAARHTNIDDDRFIDVGVRVVSPGF